MAHISPGNQNFGANNDNSGRKLSRGNDPYEGDSKAQDNTGGRKASIRDEENQDMYARIGNEESLEDKTDRQGESEKSYSDETDRQRKDTDSEEPGDKDKTDRLGDEGEKEESYGVFEDAAYVCSDSQESGSVREESDEADLKSSKRAYKNEKKHKERDVSNSGDVMSEDEALGVSKHERKIQKTCKATRDVVDSEGHSEGNDLGSSKQAETCVKTPAPARRQRASAIEKNTDSDTDKTDMSTKSRGKSHTGQNNKQTHVDEQKHNGTKPDGLTRAPGPGNSTGTVEEERKKKIRAPGPGKRVHFTEGGKLLHRNVASAQNMFDLLATLSVRMISLQLQDYRTEWEDPMPFYDYKGRFRLDKVSVCVILLFVCVHVCMYALGMRILTCRFMAIMGGLCWMRSVCV